MFKSSFFAYSAALILSGSAFFSTTVEPQAAQAHTAGHKTTPIISLRKLIIKPAAHKRRRYRHKQRGFRHFYGGFWYASPWWLFGPPVFGPTIVITTQPRYRASRHVRWCLNKYRSYRPRTYLYLAYSGRYRVCRSPYRP
ncbi:MAG: BA14K family protein [Hyphomicrobiales bacterium]